MAERSEFSLAAGAFSPDSRLSISSLTRTLCSTAAGDRISTAYERRRTIRMLFQLILSSHSPLRNGGCNCNWPDAGDAALRGCEMSARLRRDNRHVGAGLRCHPDAPPDGARFSQAIKVLKCLHGESLLNQRKSRANVPKPNGAPRIEHDINDDVRVIGAFLAGLADTAVPPSAHERAQTTSRHRSPGQAHAWLPLPHERTMVLPQNPRACPSAARGCRMASRHDVRLPSPSPPSPKQAPTRSASPHPRHTRSRTSQPPRPRLAPVPCPCVPRTRLPCLAPPMPPAHKAEPTTRLADPLRRPRGQRASGITRMATAAP